MRSETQGAGVKCSFFHTSFQLFESANCIALPYRQILGSACVAVTPEWLCSGPKLRSGLQVCSAHESGPLCTANMFPSNYSGLVRAINKQRHSLCNQRRIRRVKKPQFQGRGCANVQQSSD
jgi:hypothetical protein